MVMSFHRRSRFKLHKTVKLVFPILSLDRKLELGTVSLALIFIVSLAPICFSYPANHWNQARFPLKVPVVQNRFHRSD
jgi:hypothetical protein